MSLKAGDMFSARPPRYQETRPPGTLGPCTVRFDGVESGVIVWEVRPRPLGRAGSPLVRYAISRLSSGP